MFNHSNASTGLLTLWFSIIPPPLPLLSPIPFPSTVMEFYHSITRVTVSHCLTIAFLCMVVLTGSAGWAVPYNIHTSLGRQNDRRWELRCQIVLSRQLTSTPFLFSIVILYLLTEAALIVAVPRFRTLLVHLTCSWYKFSFGGWCRNNSASNELSFKVLKQLRT